MWERYASRSLETTYDEAEIVQWLIHEGDTAKLDQPIARVETDKAIVELPAPVSGRVREIRVKDGQTAKVGDVLVIFDSSTPANGDTPIKSSETQPSSSTTSSTPSIVSHLDSNFAVTPTTPATPVTVSHPDSNLPSTSSPSTKRPRVLAAPAVRKLAFELGIDIEQVTSSNPNGRVSLEDVRAYAERAKATPEPVQPTAQSVAPTAPQKMEQAASPTADQRQPLTGLRKRIAEHMERSWRTIPHATAFAEIDGTGLMALRHALKSVAEQRGTRLTYMPLLVKLLLPVLKEFPIFNASLDEEKREIIYKRSYHIGIATDSPDGLLVPVLRDAERLTLLEIATKLEKLIEGARHRTLSLPELSGSTFTLNNIGSFGGSTGTPIINYPEAAILAVGRLQEKAVVSQGSIIARPMMPLTLSFDHRLIDGALAAKFLGRFKELVENPQQLMLDMV